MILVLGPRALRIQKTWRKEKVMVHGPRARCTHWNRKRRKHTTNNMCRACMPTWHVFECEILPLYLAFPPERRIMIPDSSKAWRCNQSNQISRFSTLETRLKLNLNKLCKFNLYFLWWCIYLPWVTKFLRLWLNGEPL